MGDTDRLSPEATRDLGLIATSSTTSKRDNLRKCKHKYCFPVVGKVVSFHPCFSEASSSVCFGQSEFLLVSLFLY